MRPCQQCQKPLEANAFSWRRFCMKCRVERDRANIKARCSTPEYRARILARRHANGVTPWGILQQQKRDKMLQRAAKAQELIAKGLSTREVARQLGTTVGVIAGLRHRVRQTEAQHGRTHGTSAMETQAQ